jgi:hypothetical protein
VSDAGLLATAAAHQPSDLAFSPGGDELGYLQRNGSKLTAELALTGAPNGTSVPKEASAAIDQLVRAEVKGDRQTLHPLITPASVETELLHNLPGGLSRGYVISAAPVGDGVTAQIRLLKDPTNGHPTALFTDQTVVLHRSGDAWQVTQSDIPRQLHDEPSGPQVIHVESSDSRILRLTTVRITFDSDLDPQSVSDSIISLGSSLGVVPPTVVYDQASRTLTVTIAGLLHRPVDLTVGIALRDVNGQGLAAPFITQVTPGR